MSLYQRILVPVDGSDTSNKGLEEAIEVAALTKGQIRVMTIIDELSFALAMDAYAGQMDDWTQSMRGNAEKVLTEAQDKAQAAGVPSSTTLRESAGARVSEHVLAEAQSWEADLIVLGTHGRRGLGRLLLGSDAEAVLRQSTVPVLLVRHVEMESASKK
ncbi:MAG: universal stress protein [Burkholderiaceae bacterium]|jgi:nucleotide-binding universal stress UspA family protein|nr:universal stress protein [Burkholderiaceae bacterium]